MDGRETALLRTPLGASAPGESLVKSRPAGRARARSRRAPARVASRGHPISSQYLLAASALLMLADGVAYILGSAVWAAVQRSTSIGVLELTPTVLLSTVIFLGSMWTSGAYSKFLLERLSTQLTRAFLICSAVLALLLVINFATGSSELGSASLLSTWYLAVLVALGTIRSLSYASTRSWRRGGRLARAVAVVDLAGTGASLAQRIQRHDPAEMHFVGMFSRENCAGYDIADLVRITRDRHIDEIIIAAGGAAGSEVASVIEQLGAVPTNLHVWETAQTTALVQREPSIVFGHSVLTVYRRPLDGWSGVLKRSEDVMLGGLILVLLLPLMGIIAALIKLDSRGPVLFRQKRLGLNNAIFEILKFRTMVHVPGPDHEVRQARQNDPRVTRIGRFLRRSSLDELPQLFNVLRGEMSLVGPRPHALPHNQHYASMIEQYHCRHRIRPGITGLAQINGFRGETDTLDKMQRRVELDLDYINRWSLRLDGKVLLKTVALCFRDRAAY